jgi:transglutaminase-like putative cysteine protease
MLFEITHETVFDYTRPVGESYMEFRLTPLTDASQHLLQHRQRVTPSRHLRQYVDALGNTVSYFNLLSPQTRIEVSFDSVVETYPNRPRGSGGAADGTGGAMRLLMYDSMRPTSLTGWGPEFMAFAGPLEGLRGSGTDHIAATLSELIHNSFRYEGEVTSAFSPIEDLLRAGAGVCQDFSHLMLATCRFLGVPARYVSGYVATDSTGGEAQASHAWCEVYDGERGWRGIDPTHNRWVGEQYVRLGIGRDYQDVPPNRGIFRGESKETMQVRVHLRPLTPEQVETRARALYPRLRPSVERPRVLREPELASMMQQTSDTQHQQQRQQQQAGS